MTTEHLPSKFKTAPRRRSLALTGLAVYLAVAVWLEWPVLLHPYTAIVGEIPDAFQYSWYLGWFWHAISQGLSPVYSSEINWPFGVGFLYNTSIISLSIFFGWLVPLTSPSVAYNLVFLVNIVLIGWISQAVLREFEVRPWLQVFGGLLFCLMPYLTAQNLGHLSITFLSPMLAMVWLAIRIIRGKARSAVRYGVWAGLLTAFQFYTSIEMTVTFFLSIAIFVLFLIMGRRGWRVFTTWVGRFPWTFWAAGIGVALVVILPGVWLFFTSGGAEVATNKFHQSSDSFYVSDLLGPLFPTSVFLVHNPWSLSITSRFVGNLEENGSYIGLPLLVLLGVFTWRRVWRGPISRSLLLSMGTFFVLSLGVVPHVAGNVLYVPLPWVAFSKVPFLNAAIPARFAFYVDTCLILWVTVALDIFLYKSMRSPFSRYTAAHAVSVPSQRRLSITRVSILVACLVAVVMWLPMNPYPHLPIYRLPRPILDRVKTKPVLWVTYNFGFDMQALASSGYALRSYDSYGFARYYSSAATSSLQWGEYAGSNANNATFWAEEVIQFLHREPSAYVLVTPFDPLPPTLVRALYTTLGHPLLSVKGCVLWGAEG